MPLDTTTTDTGALRPLTRSHTAILDIARLAFSLEPVRQWEEVWRDLIQALREGDTFPELALPADLYVFRGNAPETWHLQVRLTDGKGGTDYPARAFEVVRFDWRGNATERYSPVGSPVGKGELRV